MFRFNTICGKVSHLVHLLSSLITPLSLNYRIYWKNFVFTLLPFLLLLPGIGVSLAGVNSWEDFHCSVTLLKRE